MGRSEPHCEVDRVLVRHLLAQREERFVRDRQSNALDDLAGCRAAVDRRGERIGGRRSAAVLVVDVEAAAGLPAQMAPRPEGTPGFPWGGAGWGGRPPP